MKTLFPYKPRPGQISIMENILNAIENKKNIMLNAPTGLGKTICSLVPAIKAGKQILFLTPRQSQHRIVGKSADDINKHLTVAQIIGKQDMCDNEKLKGASNFYDACSMARKKTSKAPCQLFKDGTCRYYNEIEKAKHADIITANYRHIFDPDIYHVFLGLTGFDTKDMVLIIDEAHNLPQVLRDIASTKITNSTCDRAQNELQLLSQVAFECGANLTNLIAEGIVYQTLGLGDTKCRVDKELIQINDNDLEWFKKAGDKIIKIKEEDGLVAPISHLHSIYNFLIQWRDMEEDTNIIVFERNSRGWVLSIKCLEPILLSAPIYNFHSTILMSGTFQPLEYFRRVLGINGDVIMKSYPSIFPPENRKLIINKNLTTQYKHRSPEMYRKYGNVITNVCGEIDGNIAVFFPSYSLMKQVKGYIESSRRIVTERSGVKIDIHKELKSRNNLLLGVMRGTLSEGVDYKDNLLSAVCVVGVPFPMQDIELKALTDYYEKKFNSGFAFASLFPTINVVLQTVGRGIRSETDKCVIHLLDRRFDSYKRWFEK